MNSVSMPSRPSSRARAASRSSSGTDHLLPALGLARGAHPDGLEQASRARGGAMDGGLGEAQALAPERVEQQQQQRAPVSLAPRPVGDRERCDQSEALL